MVYGTYGHAAMLSPPISSTDSTGGRHILTGGARGASEPCWDAPSSAGGGGRAQTGWRTQSRPRSCWTVVPNRFGMVWDPLSRPAKSEKSMLAQTLKPPRWRQVTSAAAEWLLACMSFPLPAAHPAGPRGTGTAHCKYLFCRPSCYYYGYTILLVWKKGSLSSFVVTVRSTPLLGVMTSRPMECPVTKHRYGVRILRPRPQQTPPSPNE